MQNQLEPGNELQSLYLVSFIFQQRSYDSLVAFQEGYVVCLSVKGEEFRVWLSSPSLQCSLYRMYIYIYIYIIFCCWKVFQMGRSPGHPSSAYCSWGIWDGSERLYREWCTWSYMSKLSSFPSLDGRVDSNLAKSEISVVGFAAARKISCQKFHSGLPPNEASSSSAFETSLS